MTHVIITGGSSGIGLEIARLFAHRGYRISLLARDADRLAHASGVVAPVARAAGGDLRTVSVNVADAGTVDMAVRACEAAFGPCTLLVTSAGIVEPGAFADMDAATFEAQIATNFFGTVHVVRAVYAGMKARGVGRIMMISSAAALIGIHGYTAYCASKSALRGFAEALRQEAAGSGIVVCACFPPDTQTPQYEAELARRSPQASALMGRLKPWPAERVARLIVAALDRGRAELHFGFPLKALAYLGGMIKPGLFWWAGRKYGRAKGLP